MGLAAPLALLGLLAVALPVIAHLLRRRDVPVRALATIALLRKADVASRRKVRIVDRMLLASRVALVAAAALALSAPFVIATLAWGDGRLASVAIVVDDSMSMGRTDGSGVVLDRAIDRAREVIDALPAGSEVALVLGGDPPRVVAARSDDLSIAHARLDLVRAESARGSALAPAIELAARQLAGARHPLRRVLVLSDLARHADPGDRDLPRDVALELERVGPAEDAGNLAVTEALAAPDPTAPGQLAIAIEVRAFGDTRTRAPVVVRRGGVEVARGEVALAEGGGRTVLRVTAPEGGDPTAEVALVLDPPDALAVDDVRGALLRPVSAPRVLMVDGDPRPLGRRGVQGGGEEVRFLAQALRLAPSDEGGFVHRAVDPDAFLSTGLDDVDVLVLANVDLRNAALRARVEQHLERGGGLLVTAGDHVTAGSLARMESMLPARVVSTIDGDIVGIERGPADDLLPNGATGLEAVRATRRLALEPIAGAEVALTWRDGSPALVLSRDRRVAVLGTSADDAWSDLPYRPGFLPLVVRLARTLAPPGAMPDAPFSPGHAPELSAPTGTTELALVGPGGRVLTFEGSALGRPIDLSDVVEPGAWRVRAATSEHPLEDAPRSAFVVAPPLDESDLSPGEEAPVTAADDQEDRTRSAVRRSFAPWLFGLVGLLAIAEGLLRGWRRPQRGVLRDQS